MMSKEEPERHLRDQRVDGAIEDLCRAIQAQQKGLLEVAEEQVKLRQKLQEFKQRVRDAIQAQQETLQELAEECIKLRQDFEKKFK